MMHFMFRKVLGDKIYRAPISKNTKRVLDIGTGTGIWAIEMGLSILAATKTLLTMTRGRIP